MPPRMNPYWRQQDFIYDLNWDEKIDNDFIDFLSFEARLGNFIWPRKVNDSLRQAIDSIQHQYKHDFSFVYALKKLDLLETRYNTFNWMLSVEGVSHDPSANLVKAPEETWRVILKEEPFAYAYLAKGEAKYEELAVIFAPEFVQPIQRNGLPIEVVYVSSDSEVAVHEPVYPPAGNEMIVVHEDVHEPEGWVMVHPDEAMVDADVGSPIHAIPLQMIPPLDMIEVSSNSTQSECVNWWDYLNLMSDEEGSSQTDISTANSFSYSQQGIRGRRIRKKPVSPKDDGIRLSSTASNSPFGKRHGSGSKLPPAIPQGSASNQPWAKPPSKFM